jgi:hypothetical protein
MIGKEIDAYIEWTKNNKLVKNDYKNLKRYLAIHGKHQDMKLAMKVAAK